MTSVECRWSSCNHRFSDFKQLEDHLTLAHVPPTSENVYIRGSDYVCGWSNCSYPPHPCASVRRNAFIRHVKFHAFVEHIICCTHALLPSSFSFNCEVSFIHLPYDFECNCNFKTDSLLSLFSHFRDCKQEYVPKMESFKFFVCPNCSKSFEDLNRLLTHASVKFDNHVKCVFRTGFFCLWMGCTHNLEGFTSLNALLEHVETHLTSSICLWIGCPARGNHNRAHLLLHAYSNVCRNNSIQLINKNPGIVSKCLSSSDNSAEMFGCHKARSTWFIDLFKSENYDGLLCRWDDCSIK